MRLTTVRTADGTFAARVEADHVVQLAWTDLSDLLSQPRWRELATADGRQHSVNDVDLATLLPFPDKIICLGLNYESHILEMGRSRPEYPTLFAKYRSALIGPNDAVQLPSVSQAIAYRFGSLFNSSAKASKNSQLRPPRPVPRTVTVVSPPDSIAGPGSSKRAS